MFGSIICVMPFKAQIVRLAFVSLQAKVQHKGMPTRDLVEGHHGHAGAIAGQRLAATAAAPLAQTRPPHRPLVQSQLSAFFHPQIAGHGLSSSTHEPHREASEAQQRRREQQILGTAGTGADAAHAEAQSSSGGTRQQAERLVHPHLASGSGERTFANAHVQQGNHILTGLPG